jgi:beta-galactosidase/beta-glucuronidase
MKPFKKESILRSEYPRPQLVREDNWINLNGEWDFVFDDFNIGLKEKWFKKEALKKFDKKIIIPFCFQSKLSGINSTDFHDIFWYRKEFIIPKKFHNKKTLIHFGAVDFSCIVYINGQYIGSHRGGYIGFSVDITEFLEEINVLTLRVEDPSEDLEIPRGKQYWKRDNESIFYPRVSGIWQTVWLEFLHSDYYLKKLKITPDIDKSEVIIEFFVHGIGFADLSLLITILFNNKEITEEDVNLDFLGKLEYKRNKKILKEKIEIFHKKMFYENPNSFKVQISIPENLTYLWHTKNPNLYDLNIKILNKTTNEIYDEVKSYFGLRKISISDSDSMRNTRNPKQILLNNTPLYQKLFLVQGYWPDGLYTAPSDEAIKKDVQFIKDFGFNGLRTHQKVFDSRFYYWCDKLGVLVWGEIGNTFRFSTKSQLELINEFISEVERDYNHPSIITWVPLNEGWGISGVEKDPKRRFFLQSLYYLLKSIDPTRLVIDNDGWWHTDCTDICTRHFYFNIDLLPKTLEEEIESHKKAIPKLYLNPFQYNNEVIIYSEIGGYGYDYYKNTKEKWGYGGLIEDEEHLFESVRKLVKEFDKRKEWIQGFCYTQLYDQFQEVNGLLTFDRKPKFLPSRLKKIIDQMFY